MHPEGGEGSCQAEKGDFLDLVGPGVSFSSRQVSGGQKVTLGKTQVWEECRLGRRTFGLPEGGSGKPFDDSGRESRA